MIGCDGLEPNLEASRLNCWSFRATGRTAPSRSPALLGSAPFRSVGSLLANAAPGLPEGGLLSKPVAAAL
jgi:hypothetical protein